MFGTFTGYSTRLLSDPRVTYGNLMGVTQQRRVRA